MTFDGSVTHWLRQLKAGDRGAVPELWQRYYRRLVGLAREALRGTSRRAADEEDVALTAFASFCRGAEGGRFPRLHDRNDLWQILLVITRRKAHHQARDSSRRKRGAGTAEVDMAVDELPGREPTPAFAAQVADECRHLLGLLGSAELRSIALLKMEGCATDEIAERLGRAPRTVERRLRLIRQIWEQEMTP